MVESYLLKLVEDSFEKDFDHIKSNVSIQDSRLFPYSEFLSSALFKKIASLPLEEISISKLEISSSKNCFLQLQHPIHTIEIGGVESILNHITVVVPKNFTGKLLIRELNPHANCELKIFMEEGSYLQIGREVYSTKYSNVSIYTKKNAKCNFIGAYDISGAQSLLFTNGYLLGESSHIDISMHGIAKNMAKVTNDTQITITHDAPYSSGHQHMKNIIWDSFSKITSKPTLEIQNNNVECSHGASVYKLSQEIKTYGNARGISDNQLVELVAEGFFSSIHELFE